MRASYLLIFLLVLTCLPASAQQPYFRHFTAREGLPSNVVYDVYHDRKGFIWFCTDQGISCFDGFRFRNYSINEGLPDNEIFEMGEDQFGRYWLCCYNRHACYLYEGRIYTAANDSLCRRIEAENVRYTSLFQGGNGVWYLQGNRIYTLSRTSIAPAFPGMDALPTSYYYTATGGREYLVSGNRIYIGRSDGTHMIQSLPRFMEHVTAATGIGNRFFYVAGYSGRDTMYTFTLAGDSVHSNRRDPVPALCYALVYQSDTALVCLTAKGIFLYNLQDGSFRRSPAYPGANAFNRLVVDREGNTWLGTLNDGVYMRPRQVVAVYNKATGLPESEVLAVGEPTKGELMACFNNGRFSEIRNGMQRNYAMPQAGGANRVKFAYVLGKGRFLAGGDRGLYLIETGHKAKQLAGESQKACVRLGNRYYIAHNSGAICYDDSSGSTRILRYERTTAIATRDGATVWLGSLNGLYCWQAGTVRKFERDSALSANRIVDLSQAGDRYLVIATHRNGLYLWDNRTLTHLARAAGLASDNCLGLCTDTAGTIWLCTDQGLDRIAPNRRGAFDIHHYTAMDGLPESKVNDVALQGEKLYVATTEGLVVLDRDLPSFGTYKAPEVYLLSVSVRDSLINWPAQKLLLTHRENNLQVSFAGVFLTDGANLQYRYVLEGGNGDTMYTHLGVINLSNLKPGDYRLLLWAKHKALTQWTEQPAVLSFRIDPPFWLTPWFLALCAGLVLLAVYSLYRMKIRTVRAREMAAASQQQKMAVLKMQALKSQINPHFMFNVLNSIQHLYSQDEDRKANQYLSLYTRLVRQALNYSEQHWIRLAEELDMQTAYLDLERMRFKSAFTYEISMAPAVDPQRIMIPTMLLQPYIENAIGHGLRGLQDRAGLLRLCFWLTNDMLVCSVEDNGIGIGSTKKRHPEGEPSFGMRLTEQRIETLNALYQTHIRVTVSDRSELASPAQGTLVVLYIPIRNYYDQD